MSYGSVSNPVIDGISCFPTVSNHSFQICLAKSGRHWADHKEEQQQQFSLILDACR